MTFSGQNYKKPLNKDVNRYRRIFKVADFESEIKFFKFRIMNPIDPNFKFSTHLHENLCRGFFKVQIWNSRQIFQIQSGGSNVAT